MTPEQILLVVLAVAVACLILLAGYLIGSLGRARRAIPGEAPPIALPPSFEALTPAFQAIQGHLSSLQGKLDEVNKSVSVGEAREEARQRAQDQAFDTLGRLSATLLGSARAGAVGERLVAEALGVLPPQWLDTGHVVANKPVEFAIRLPDGLVLPIDSKVAAQAKLMELDQTQDEQRREALESDIRDEVLKRAKEVRKYVDTRTPGFAVAVVSDAAYRLCGPILPIAYRDHQALVVPYSLLTPFVLMIYEQHRSSGLHLDTAQQVKALIEAENHLKRVVDELNGRMSNALTQFRNSYEALSGDLTKAKLSLESVRVTVQEREQVGA